MFRQILLIPLYVDDFFLILRTLYTNSYVEWFKFEGNGHSVGGSVSRVESGMGFRFFFETPTQNRPADVFDDDPPKMELSSSTSAGRGSLSAGRKSTIGTP